jgi:hypothetical protein
MIRASRLIVFVAAMVLVAVLPAEANMADDVWDALEALSGPGPFTGPPGIQAAPICFDKGRHALFRHIQKADKKYPCVYVDVRALAVGAKPPYDRVTARLTEAGFTWEPYGFLEVGAGAGLSHFRSKGIGTNRFSVTPLRLVVMPGALFSKSPRARAFKYFFRPTVMFGHLTGRNFGVAPGALDVGAETLLSAGVLIDPVELIFGR